jgi:hypothetical protein
LGVVVRACIDEVAALCIGFQAFQYLCHFIQRIGNNDHLSTQDANHLSSVWRVGIPAGLAVDLTPQLASLLPFFF